MEATATRLLDYLRKSPQLVVPIYQRTYSWTEDECKQLWDDIVRTGKDDSVPAHFIGSIVYVEKRLYQVTNQVPLLVIDGQQRLTTVTLLIEVLARAVGDSEPVDGFSANKLRHYYLKNEHEKGERRYKLLLSQTDKLSLIAVLDGTEEPRDVSLRVKRNFAFLQKLVDGCCNGDLETVCKGLSKLVIVDISLDRDRDNPQLIFESMNSTGKELSQADLIRNYVLLSQEPETQTRLYESYWRPIEQDFGQGPYAADFDNFVRHFLTLKLATGEIPNQRDVYAAFKRYAQSVNAGVEALLADVRMYASYYCAMALGAEPDHELKTAFQDLRELKVNVAFPLLLKLYHDYKMNELTKVDFLRATRSIESYVFRRAVCGIETKSLNKTFSSLGKRIINDRYLASLQAAFLLMPSYRRFPDDSEFVRELQTRDLYNMHTCSYAFRRLDNAGRKERVSMSEFTIEHIMPQNKNLSPKWKADLGPGWENVQKIYLHTLGNLTLTGYNSEYSDRPFLEKRDMEGGFSSSPLKLNRGLRDLESWNEQAIKDRAAVLAAEMAELWISPSLDEKALDSYREADPKSGRYSIDDHPRLASGELHEVFQQLRAQISALDPCITEEFLKPYVAYKAESNFALVRYKAKELRVTLYIPMLEINDPRGICRTSKRQEGHSVANLSAVHEVQYIAGLVRQCFERQMGLDDELTD